jgi:hypothetical protein
MLKIGPQCLGPRSEKTCDAATGWDHERIDADLHSGVNESGVPTGQVSAWLSRRTRLERSPLVPVQALGLVSVIDRSPTFGFCFSAFLKVL